MVFATRDSTRRSATDFVLDIFWVCLSLLDHLDLIFALVVPKSIGTLLSGGEQCPVTPRLSLITEHLDDICGRQIYTGPNLIISVLSKFVADSL